MAEDRGLETYEQLLICNRPDIYRRFMDSYAGKLTTNTFHFRKETGI